MVKACVASKCVVPSYNPHRIWPLVKGPFRKQMTGLKGIIRNLMATINSARDDLSLLVMNCVNLVHNHGFFINIYTFKTNRYLE